MKLILFLVAIAALNLMGCTVEPFMREDVAGNTTVSGGGTILTASDDDSLTYSVTTKKGTVMTVTHHTVKKDETHLSGSFYGYKSTVGVAKILGHSTDIKTRTDAAPGIIKAKGDAATSVIKAKGDAAVGLQNAANAAPAP